MSAVLIVGSGDIARRLLPHLLHTRQRVYLLRRDHNDSAPSPTWHDNYRRHPQCTLIGGDLDRRSTLARCGALAAVVDTVIHLAPPPADGKQDTRTRHLLAALGGRASLPRRFIYLSTSGVYGDCGGDWVRETRPPNPQTARAVRRLDAETVLRTWAKKTGVRLSILRVPGIYAAERLPLARLRQALPMPLPQDDVYSNHIHAEDLVKAILAALRRGRSCRLYHTADQSDLKMGDFFDRVAAACRLPAPPRQAKNKLTRMLSAVQLSFLSESRRLDNHRLCDELGWQAQYPTVDDFFLHHPNFGEH